MKALKSDNWVPVCALDDLVENSGICALVNGRQIAIFYLPDQQPSLYAIGNWDPIGKANVLSRGIVAEVDGGMTVASPLYKQHFNLETGQCLENPDMSVPVYEIAVDRDAVVVGQ
ncbi:MAG: nitrite reductase small subunit NirD [bacterium]